MCLSFDLTVAVRERLAEFAFKQKNGWLEKGRCPSCQQKELYTRADKPWVVRCNRLNRCGYSAHIRELYPDLFEQWSKRFQPTAANPHASAEAYLVHHRGFDLAKIQGCYQQAMFYDATIDAGSATVRFHFAGTWWERLIDEPRRFGGQKARFQAGGHYAGQWFVPPNVDLMVAKQVWITEGIFDAIALMHHGLAAVSMMSSGNYPQVALEQLRADCVAAGSDCPTLVWALDGDTAGCRAIKQFKARAEDQGWLCLAAVIPQTKRSKQDWNDLHVLDISQSLEEESTSKKPRLKHLSASGLEHYLFEGACLTAPTAAEKALLLYQQKQQANEFEFDFNQRLYWFKLDLEKYHAKREQIDHAHPDWSEVAKRERAVRDAHMVTEIANCVPTPLYYQANTITGEAWYYYRVDFPHDGPSVKDTFSSAQIATAAEFKKRLLGIAPGAVYTGKNSMLERAIKHQLFNIKRVETIDYIGYCKTYGAYLFNDLAVKDGVMIPANEEDYYDLGRIAVKSLNHSVELLINRDLTQYSDRWFKAFMTAFGAKGMAALTFWLGSLLAEQIRAEQKSFPFLEIVGEAGSGKSTLIEFLWKLLGRIDYEGFDPSKSTHAGRARNLAQVSGLPVVLIESDREQLGDKSHIRTFDWDELKTAYNGRSIRLRGMATSGNETFEPPFRGTIVISQNNAVDASEAIMTRICQIQFERNGQTAETRQAAHVLESMPISEVSGFILKVTLQAKRMLVIIQEKTEIYQQQLLEQPEIKTVRLAKNHGQLMACLDALKLVVPMTEMQYRQGQQQLLDMTIARQQAINADHPLVQAFWDMYEYLNGEENDPRLNHSRNNEEIAINLNHFTQIAVEHKQSLPPLLDLKNALKTSRRFRYVGQKVVNSAIRNRYAMDQPSTSLRCWIFNKPLLCT